MEKNSKKSTATSERKNSSSSPKAQNKKGKAPEKSKKLGDPTEIDDETTI